MRRASGPRSSLVHFSSARNEWATPADLFNRLNDTYHFTLDPCCTTETAKCAKHFTIAENGLAQDWSKDRVFMNPPYGRAIGLWMKKAYEESLRGALVVCLVPARTDTHWWHEYAMGGGIEYIRGRVRFAPNGDFSKRQPAPFPSAIVVFKPKIKIS